MIAKIPLLLGPQPAGGTLLPPLLSELITEGNTLSEEMRNAEDAFAVASEIFEDKGLPLPMGIEVDCASAVGPVAVETTISFPVP